MYNEAWNSRNNPENNDPFKKANSALEWANTAEEQLQRQFDQQKHQNTLSPEEQETSQNIEDQLHELLKKWDVVRLNEILRDPNLKQFISGQLQNEIFSELRSISMDKVRGHVRDGNMWAVKEEMSGRLVDVKKWYGDIFQRLAEELNKPEVLSEDRATIAQLQGEVEEAETMVDQLLSSINSMSSASKRKENTPPPPLQDNQSDWNNF